MDASTEALAAERPRRRIMVTAAGLDRPGIVAAVTRLLYEHGSNLEDSAMTRLEGAFAMILIVQVPDDLEAREGFQRDLAQVAGDMGLTIHMRDLERAETHVPESRGDPWIISLYGADRPGLVFRVAELLEARDINITDVVTHRTQQCAPGRSALYHLALEIEMPRDADGPGLEAALGGLAREMQVEISCHAVEPLEL